MAHQHAGWTPLEREYHQRNFVEHLGRRGKIASTAMADASNAKLGYSGKRIDEVTILAGNIEGERKGATGDDVRSSPVIDVVQHSRKIVLCRDEDASSDGQLLKRFVEERDESVRPDASHGEPEN